MHNHIKKMAAEHPEKIEEIVDAIAAEYGEKVYDYFNCHIKDEAAYMKFANRLKNFDKTTGAHWSLATIEQKISTMQPRINFAEKPYTMYDFAYGVNMLYSKFGDYMNVDNIFMATQRYLEDENYCGDPSERAYHHAKKLEKYRK